MLIWLLLLVTFSASIGMHFFLAATSTTVATTQGGDKDVPYVRHMQASISRLETQRNTTYNTRSRLVSPLWACSSESDRPNKRSSKLVFVHVFKTAGMTLRELLARYAHQCQRGIGLVSECSGLSADSISGLRRQNTKKNNHNTHPTKNDYWINTFGSKRGKFCKLQAMNATHIISLPNGQVRAPLTSSQLDILGGHLPLLGTASSLAVWDETPSRVQYLVFFRRAMDKFVSGIMYQKKDQNYSFQQIVDLIQTRVRGELKQRKYREGYSAYLLTPQQKELFYGGSSQTSVEERTQQILQNLEQENILVGIVEQMSESLELLQFVIDKKREQTPLFEAYGMKRHENDGNDSSHRNHSSGKVNNPSKFSTSSVVAVLEQDKEFFAQISEYVKYDDLIYNHALRLHALQYKEFKGQSSTTTNNI